MSLSKVKVTLPNDTVTWFYETFHGVSISYLISELIQRFRESAEAEEGSVEEILSRFDGV